MIVPVIALAPTYINLTGFSLINCDAFAFEGLLFQFYRIAFGIIAMFWILALLIRKYHVSESNFKKQIVLMGIGIESFLFLFFTVTFLAAYLTKTGVLPDSRLEYYGLFGIVIFIIYISILIVRFRAFNIKLIATQALIWGLAILIASQFFFIKEKTNFILNGIGFLAAIILGQNLIKSVKKEIEQKEQLATLLKQRASLVHLITHKVKGSFARTKAIFSEMLVGTFGEISPEAKKMAEKGLSFDNNGIQTVNLVLNVDNMQSGLVKYDMKNTNFKDLVEEVASEKKNPAEEKGLGLEVEIIDDNYNMTGDPFWLKEAINNLIDNSIRYTKEGKIMVGLTKHDNKILFSVKDTGVGINEEDKKHLFMEGGRGAKSVEINVDSTGYGLFTVKLIVDAHKGKVWGESEGPNKGSQFYIELPISEK